MAKQWTIDDLVNLHEQLLHYDNTIAENIRTDLENFFLTGDHPLFSHPNMINDLYNLIKLVTSFSVEDETLLSLCYSLIKFCSILLKQAIIYKMDSRMIINCAECLLCPNLSIYQTSNKYSHNHDRFWDYVKVGMKVNYQEKCYIISDINYASQHIDLTSTLDQSVVSVPFYSKDISVNAEISLDAYQDWVNDLRYGNVVDICKDHEYYKAYYKGEDANGNKQFDFHYQIKDTTLSLSNIDPTMLAFPNTLDFGSYYPLSNPFFYLEPKEQSYIYSNNQFPSCNGFSVGPIPCHNDSPLFIHCIHCLEENDFIPAFVKMIEKEMIVAPVLSSICDMFISILPFYYHNAYLEMVADISQPLLSLYYQLLKTEAVKYPLAWKLAYVLRGSNSYQHIDIIVNLISHYYIYQQNTYLYQAKEMIKQVIQVITKYGINMQIGHDSMNDEQTKDLLLYFIELLFKNNIMDYTLCISDPYLQDYGMNFIKDLIADNLFDEKFYPYIWNACISLIQRRLVSCLSNLFSLLNDYQDPCLYYLFHQLLQFCQENDWLDESQFFILLIETWSEYPQTEEIIALYRHYLQKQSSYVVDTKLLNYMNCYLQRFYTDPSTSLNTILNSLLSQLQVPSANPNFEMSLLSWLVSRHITITTEEQLTTLFSILSTLCSNPSYLDYLEKAIDLLISSFSMCTVTQLPEFASFWNQYTHSDNYFGTGLIRSLCSSIQPSLKDNFLTILITYSSSSVYMDLSEDDYSAYYSLWFDVYEKQRKNPDYTIDASFFYNCCFYSNTVIVARCCIDWAVICCEYGLANNSLLPTCLDQIQNILLVIQQQPTKCIQLLQLIMMILCQLHEIVHWDNIDLLKENDKPCLVSITNTHSSISISKTKPLYLLKPKLMKDARMKSIFFDVFVEQNGKQVLVKPWESLNSYITTTTQVLIVCKECTRIPSHPESFIPIDDQTISQFIDLCYPPLLSFFQQQTSDLSSLWCIIDCLPIPSSYYDKKRDEPLLSVETYSSFFSAPIESLVYSLHLLYHVLNSNKQPNPINGNLIQIIQPMIFCYSTLATKYPTPCSYSLLTTQLLGSVNNLLLKRIQKEYKNSSLFLRYRNSSAWINDVTSTYTTVTKNEDICITDSDFQSIIQYISSVLPFLSDEDPVCLDLLTNLTLFAFLTPLKSKDSYIHFLLSLTTQYSQKKSLLVWSIITILISDSQLLETMIPSLIHSTSSIEARVLRGLLEKRFLSSDQVVAYLQSIQDQMKEAEENEEKALSILLRNNTILSTIVNEETYLAPTVLTIMDNFTQFLFSCLTKPYDHSLITDSLALLIEIISCLGLSESSKQALDNLWIEYQDITVTKSSDLVDRVHAKHSGMRNLGCICYLLSVMQQFFMIPAFRQGILETKWTGILAQRARREGDEEQSSLSSTQIENLHLLLTELQSLYKDLLLNQQDEVDPTRWCQLFTDEQGMGISIYEQEDAHEYLTKFLSRIESALQYTDHPTLINDLFEGEVCDQLKCPNCGIIRDKRTPFTNISLDSSDHGTLAQSLQQYGAPEIISDFCCEKCNQRVNVEKTTHIVKLPSYFIIQLKLFEFDYVYMRRRKLKPLFTFPMKIDFSQSLHLTETQSYSLKGTVVHMGSADSGHYYSYIRDDEQEGSEWNEFNDEIVSSQSAEQLRLLFEEHKASSSSYQQTIATPYLLFYENSEMAHFPIKSKDELICCEEAADLSKKRVLLRLLGLNEWPYFLQTCIQKDPHNPSLLLLFMQYAMQVIPFIHSATVHKICEEILSSLPIEENATILVEYSTKYHILASYLSSNYQLTSFESKLVTLVSQSIHHYLKNTVLTHHMYLSSSSSIISSNLTTCLQIADDLLNTSVLTSQLSSNSATSYCTLLKCIFDIPTITALFICNNVYVSFFETLSRYCYYCPVACKDIYSTCAASLKNAQTLVSCIDSLQDNKIYIGSDNDITLLRETAASSNKSIVSLSMTDLAQFDMLDIDAANTVIILPETFVNYIISVSFIQLLIHTQSKNALIQLIFYCCRNNLRAMKRLLNSMKRVLIKDIAHVDTNVPMLFTIINFLSERDDNRKKELITYLVCDPDSIWKLSLSSGTSLADLVIAIFEYILDHPDCNVFTKNDPQFDILKQLLESGASYEQSREKALEIINKMIEMTNSMN